MIVYRMTQAEIEAEGEARAAQRSARRSIVPAKPTLTMAEGRREKALSGVVCHNGILSSRRALVDRMKQAGATVRVTSTERRLMLPNGNYLAESQIGKTAMDYASGRGAGESGGSQY